MPILQLTKRNIDKLDFVTDGRIDYFDTELKGLFLRVGQSSKVFYVKTEVKESGKSKSVKAKIGAYGEFTPEQARQKAPELLQKMRAGKPVVDGKIPTIQDLYDRYLKDKPLAPSTVTQYRLCVLTKFKDWLPLDLVEAMQVLKPDVVIERYTDVLNGSGKGMAGNAFKCLQAIFKYGSILYPQYIDRNPVRIIGDASLWQRVKARIDCVEPEQFPAFYAGMLKFPVIHRDCYLFALYQGVRPDEAHSLRWDDVNTEKKQAYIRHLTETSKISYTIPLCKQVVEIISRRFAARVDGNPFVFPSDDHKSKSGHVQLRAEVLRNRTGLDVTCHGLRRTYITTGERLRLRRQDINLLTGHSDSSVTGKHYVQLGVEDLRITGQAIADEIERRMLAVPAKVIDITTRREAM